MRKLICLFALLTFSLFSCGDDGLITDEKGYVKFQVVVREPNELRITDVELTSTERDMACQSLIEVKANYYFGADSSIYFQPWYAEDPKLMMWWISGEIGLDVN